MHLLVTIPQPNGSNYNEAFAPLIRELFSRERAGMYGPYYFVRTWDARAGAEVLQISVDGVSDPDTTRDELRRLAQRYGCAAQVEETPREAVPSPLWNAGFDGSGFSDSSKRLFQKAAPTLVEFLDRAAEERDPLNRALGAIRLMVAHSRATLLRSPQRELDGYDFRELLSLRLLSYRSHFEAIYPRSKDPESFEAACARFYEQVGPATRDFIAECGDPDIGPTGDRAVAQWTELVVSGSAGLAAEFLDGTVVDAGRTLEDLVREQGGPVEPTRFHTPPSPELNRLMHRDADFLAFRLHTSLLYSCLYSLGFSLAERYVFCYVVARACEEVAGRSTEELRDDLDRLAKSMAAVSSPATG
ncbi:hypothetical protein [Streptomyces hesseae]|uniref:Thiopeptide-type bacteriocin biosynthesis domain-containing protein n=1 Tax=Streptomyces hesseae TaxID=3075519 RepID=A0ABU2SII3_9ACTN|nr:hypothetical protein [Streptomyces sp. DSM 40473]MDT0448779.1 hypothetical protein [Streptomyces sp. DSM 40473]